ncbi:MAG TPA: ABC transporter substrate-binding protein [Gammaproteobacteria bacterium]|nr:ABC transporter substrate-binding protein [Gammaproteobacteria bacterium]
MAVVRAVLLAVIAALLLGGCSRPPDRALRFGLSEAPANLDPRYATDAASARVNRLLYRRLVRFDARERPEPELATWKRLTPVHYRFHLGRQGRRFHDGSELTARDVKATYESVLDPANGSPKRATLAVIKRIRVADPDTVDFYLSHPDLQFPAYLTIGILPAQSIAAGRPFQDHPLGSGPFRFVAWPQTSRLVLQRVADGQRVVFLEVRDPTVRALKLLRGEIDMLQNNMPAELIAYLRRQPGVRIQEGPGSNFTYLGFNLKDPAVRPLVVRKAIAHAIDRRAIIRYVLAGAARPANALLPPAHWAGDPGLRGYGYDPARARALLQQAGYGPGHPLHLTYKTSSDPLRVRLATVLQDELGKVGIAVKLQSYDWGTFYGDIKAGRFQMYSLSWVGIKSPDIFRYVFYSTAVPPAGANRGRFDDPEVDRLIDAAGRADSVAAQARDYRRVQARLLAELPYVPLWYEDQVYVCRAGIEGYRLATDGNYDGLQWVHRGRAGAGDGQGTLAAQ